VKNIPTALLDFLLSSGVESCYVANLFMVQLPSGQTFYATDGQLPVTYEGNTYQPTAYGNWEIVTVRTELGISSQCEFSLTADFDTIVQPFDVPMLQLVQLGLFDAGVITIYRVYMPAQWGDVSLGAEIVYSGQITEFNKTGRTLAEGTAEAYTFKLNQQMPRNTLQPGCIWVLGSAACTVNLADFSQTGAVGSSSNAVTIVPATAFTQPDNYFTQGVLTFTSGKNTGLSMGVQSYIGGQLRLSRSMIFPVATGDTFTVVAGCDHTYPTCIQKFNNAINYGGTPFIPAYETSL
jgi:uncharacterized phage protein (TIGR02218 family)